MTGLKRGTVSLAPHDPQWAAQAQDTIRVLREAFGKAAVDIQHIGSTAINGIQAKPILDIAVGVESMEGLPLNRLLERGFQQRHNRFSTNLLYVQETEDKVRTHQVHILEYGSLQWHNYVDFRDYMNAHPEKAAEYEELKQRLAGTCGNVQTVYTDGKHDYMEITLAEARRFAKEWREKMTDIVQLAALELAKLSDAVSPGKHIATGDIRRLSGRLYRQAGVKTIGQVLALCGEFLSRRDWALGVIAFDWAYRLKAQYTEDTYPVFYRWLKEYVRGWGDCDDFCTHAFGELLRQHKGLFPQILAWTEDEDFWVRRAAAVVLIPSIMRNDYAGLEPLTVADRLLADSHDLVRKGYGWMLKCLSQVDPDGVEAYLTAHCKEMPRVAYRYALEKFDKETKRRLMAL